MSGRLVNSLTVSSDGKLMMNYRKWQELTGDTAAPPQHDGALMFWRAYVDRPWRHFTKPRLNDRQVVAVFIGLAILVALIVATIVGHLLGIGYEATQDLGIAMYVVYGTYIAWWELEQAGMVDWRPNWVRWPSFDRLLSKPNGPRGLLLLPAIPFILAGMGLSYTVSVLAEVWTCLSRPLPELGIIRPAWNATVRITNDNTFFKLTLAIAVTIGCWVMFGLPKALVAFMLIVASYLAINFVVAVTIVTARNRTVQLHAEHQPALQQLILQVFGNEDLYGWVCRYRGESPAVHSARRSMINGLEDHSTGLMPVELSASELAEIVQAYATTTGQEPLVPREVLAHITAGTERTWLGYIRWHIRQWLSPQITVREKPVPLHEQPANEPVKQEPTEAEKEAA